MADINYKQPGTGAWYAVTATGRMTCVGDIWQADDSKPQALLATLGKTDRAKVTMFVWVENMPYRRSKASPFGWLTRPTDNGEWVRLANGKWEWLYYQWRSRFCTMQNGLLVEMPPAPEEEVRKVNSDELQRQMAMWG